MTIVPPAIPAETPPEPRAAALSLADAVVQSVKNCNSSDPEFSKKMLTSILVTGGLAKTPGLPELLLAMVSGAARAEVDRVPGSRECDPAIVGWRGAAMASKLESTNEAWITGREWQDIGLRVLKERTAFY